jgi:DnaJ-class molecular chaperone
VMFLVTDCTQNVRSCITLSMRLSRSELIIQRTASKLVWRHRPRVRSTDDGRFGDQISLVISDSLCGITSRENRCDTRICPDCGGSGLHPVSQETYEMCQGDGRTPR